MRTLLICLFFSLHSLAIETKEDSLRKKYEYYLQNLKNQRDLGNEKQMLISAQKAITIAEILGGYSIKGKVYIALGNYYYDKSESSTAAYDYYYKGYRAYSKDKDSIKIAKTLLRLAILEKNTRNYLKSKESCFKSLALLNTAEPDFLESIYNNLGIVYNELKDVRSSVFYHKKALELRNKYHDQELILQSYNNIGTCYLENGFLKNAAQFYRLGLSYPKQILEQFPKEYSRLLDNNAYLKYLRGDKGVLSDLLKALYIRDSIKHQAGIVTSYLHLASYHQGVDDTKASDVYANKAYQNALANKNYGDALVALVVLESNSQKREHYKKALRYARQYNSIVAYLAKEELKIGEKFADIRYQATQKEKDNQKLKEQGRLQLIKREELKFFIKILIGILVFITLVVVFYTLYSRLKAKEKQLIINQKEQESQKQIAELLLEQYVFAQRAKLTEQKRISEDLHDSVAGKLSGMKLQMDNLSLKSELKIKPLIDSLVNQMEGVVGEIQDIVYDLNNQRIVQSSYDSLIKELILQQAPIGCLPEITSSKNLDWESISNSIKVVCYYILQQALRNIQEHAQATQVQVNFEVHEKQLIMQVIDNGRGFDASMQERVGIPSMQKRASSVGAIFNIETKIEKGTKIEVQFTLS